MVFIPLFLNNSKGVLKTKTCSVLRTGDMRHVGRDMIYVGRDMNHVGGDVRYIGRDLRHVGNFYEKY